MIHRSPRVPMPGSFTPLPQWSNLTGGSYLDRTAALGERTRPAMDRFDQVSSATVCIGLTALGALVIMVVSWVLYCLGG